MERLNETEEMLNETFHLLIYRLFQQCLIHLQLSALLWITVVWSSFGGLFLLMINLDSCRKTIYKNTVCVAVRRPNRCSMAPHEASHTPVHSGFHRPNTGTSLQSFYHPESSRFETHHVLHTCQICDVLLHVVSKPFHT